MTGELETLMLDRMVRRRVILDPRAAPADPPWTIKSRKSNTEIPAIRLCIFTNIIKHNKNVLYILSSDLVRLIQLILI